MTRWAHTLLFLILLSLRLAGQEADSPSLDPVPAGAGLPDSLRMHPGDRLVGADTAVVRAFDWSHDARKAMMYSLVLPGLGQAYNGKYYKIPIVYAGFAGLAYAVHFNTQKYKIATSKYLETGDDQAMKVWKQYMERSYILVGALYGLQVLDAYVDAQMFNWDVSEDLSLRVVPHLEPLPALAGGGGNSYGIRCSFTLKSFSP
ncbi:MAG: DUF5683 domain-containing protein [Bacteroidales bacterium]